jgi:hypothetical protein
MIRLSKVRLLFIFAFPKVRIADLINLISVLANIPLQLGEEGQSITVLPLSPADSPASTLYIVGTALIDGTEVEPTKGRLLVIAEGEAAKDGARSFELVGQREIKGCAYAVAKVCGSYLAAAINSQVRLASVPS